MLQTKFGFNAFTLRVLALVTMLIDHAGMMLFPGAIWMRYVGRLAFPIFAFQVAEGYHHTHDLRRYSLRLALFGLISEIPFDLMLGGEIFLPQFQNVMFTLLMGLGCCWLFDRKQYLPMAVALIATEFLGTDYGTLGAASVVLFHVFRGKPGYIALSTVLVHGLLYGGAQIFALAALVPILLYNGKKGPGGKLFQLGAYLFYPAHMLVLYLLTA